MGVRVETMSRVGADNGVVYAFGDNSLGQLGLGHLDPIAGVVQVTALADLKITQAECGWTHALALDGTCSKSPLLTVPVFLLASLDRSV